MKHKLYLIILAIAWLPVCLSAQDAPKSIFELLHREDYLSMSLELDFKKLRREKMGDTYQPAKISFADAAGNEQALDIKVKPKGHMRRKVCDLPPLKFKFPKGAFPNDELKPNRVIEAVILCRDNRSFEQYVLREYFAYKLYNMLTDLSFRVQLAKIKFTDVNGKDAPSESFAILIEPEEEAAERMNGKRLKARYMSGRLLNHDNTELFCLFQFMIGNTDWYVFNGHNAEVFGFNGIPSLIPVPYDFDYAGMVNTPYAVPNDHFPDLKHVTERCYMGYCRSEEETAKTIQVFLGKKEEMLKACREFPYFDDGSRKHVSNYLGSFFEIIENPKWVKREILQHCNQWLK